MSVTFDASDVESSDKFPLAWKIERSAKALLGTNPLRSVVPLTEAKAQHVANKFRPFWDFPRPFDYQQYHGTRAVSLQGESRIDLERHRQLLRSFPVGENHLVYVSWRVVPDCAALTIWRMFVDNYDDMWYPHDVLAIFDDEVDWIVIMGPEEAALYVERGGVDPTLPEDHYSFGRCLLGGFEK